MDTFSLKPILSVIIVYLGPDAPRDPKIEWAEEINRKEGYNIFCTT